MFFAKATFEQEANFFGAETIFPGARFRTLARDFRPNFAAIFSLADQHGASRQSTAWRFVEEQDESVALPPYYPTSAIDDYGIRERLERAFDGSATVRFAEAASLLRMTAKTLRRHVADGSVSYRATGTGSLRMRREAPQERDKGFDGKEAETILSAMLRKPSYKISVEMAAARRWVRWVRAYSGARVN